MSRLLLVLALLSTATPPSPAALRVKASPAVAPCVAAAAAAYERATGARVLVETAALFDAASTDGADVVVAADLELHRIIEGGATDPGLDIDVATIPWVLAAASGAEPVSAEALGRSKAPVRVLGGTVGREASRSLARQGIGADRVERLREPVAPLRLQPGESAVVPLSLAGPGPVSSLDIPPLVARALGVRASARKAEARAFVAFLGGEPGNAAFRACGRTDAR
jgi:ABC-type molybdate transport system substrate-binding protein